MTSNFQKFKLDFEKAIKKEEKKITQVVRAAALETFSDIIKNTPVGNPTYWQSAPPEGYTGGTLRSNWQTNVGSVPSGTVANAGSKSAATKKAEDDAKTGSKKFTLDNTMYFANNLPYAQRINDGYSVQPGVPQKFVEKATNKWKQRVANIANKQKDK
jgi:hypothetical protein